MLLAIIPTVTFLVALDLEGDNARKLFTYLNKVENSGGTE